MGGVAVGGQSRAARAVVILLAVAMLFEAGASAPAPLFAAGAQRFPALGASLRASEGPAAEDAPTHLEDRAYAAQFRALYGLPSDPDTLASAQERFATSEFGLPLSPNELSDLRGRVAAEDGILALRLRLERHVDSFGGLFIDQSAGGVVDIAVREGGEAAAIAEERADPVGLPVRVRIVDHSIATLEEVETTVLEMFDELLADGISVVGVAIDIPANRVRVRVKELTPQEHDLILRLFSSDVVVVERGDQPIPGACTRTACIPPMKGGLRVTSADGGPCTSGVMMSAGFGGNVFATTAGHCGPLNSAWNHSTTYIGRMTKNRFVSGSFADVAAMDIANSLESNKIFIDGGVITGITGVQGQDNDNPGDTVCHSGVTSGTRCGPLEAVESYPLERKTLLAQRRAQIPFTYGDSGAPVYKAYTSTKAVGIGSAFDATGNFWYGHIYYVARELGLVVCVNPTCT